MPADPVAARAVFLEAAAVDDPVARAALVAARCGGDAALLDRVNALLAANDRALADEGTVSLAGRADAAATAAVAPDADATADRPGLDEVAGAVIAGKYTLAEPVGEGGMGSVWRAKQTEPVKRFVAVKLIKAGMDSKQVLARFEAERQALAMMDHPNIAKVLDGGLHDHRPFFVMELVKGVPITDYCDRHKLTPQARLELFVQACQAIQHAHQKGVIHRDIKPSNVLVALYDDRPVVKVIDFGVAKATGGTLTERTIDTGFGGVVGTPAYMSPEQATFNNQDIDTRSDVYALGVLLYELLTGSPPFSGKELQKKGLLEMLRVVREEEPPRPSTRLSTADALPTLSANRGTEPKKLTGLLRNELDWIVMKALEKDRARRYETANGFAADVLRYLTGEPVLAHPPSAGYRLRKFVKRNRVQVIAGSLVVLALFLGIVGTTWGMMRAEEKRGEAEQAKQRESERADGEAKAKAVAEAETQRAIAYQNQALAALRATTSEDVEKLIGEKQDLSPNEKAYLEAVASRWQTFARQEGSDRNSRTIRAEGHLRVGYLWMRLGRKEEAREHFEIAVAQYSKLAAEFPAVPSLQRELSASHNNLGATLKGLWKMTLAEEQFRKGLAVDEKLVADFPEVPDYVMELAGHQSNLGHVLTDLGRHREAEVLDRKGQELLQKLVAKYPDVPKYRALLAGSHNNTGKTLSDLGEWVKVEEQFRKGVAILVQLVAEFPTLPEYRLDLARTRINLGGTLETVGKWTEAEEQLRQGLATADKLVNEYPTVAEFRRVLALAHARLGNLMLVSGKPVEAEKQTRLGQTIREKLTTDFPTVAEYRAELAMSHTNFCELLRKVGRKADAIEQQRKGLAILEKLVGEYPAVPLNRYLLGISHNRLGDVLKDDDSLTDAEAQFRKGLAVAEKLVNDYHDVADYRNNLATLHDNLGSLLSRIGKGAEAAKLQMQGLAIREKLVADFPSVREYRVQLGNLYLNVGVAEFRGGKFADALVWTDKAIVTFSPVLVAEPRSVVIRDHLRNCYQNRAIINTEMQRYADAAIDWGKTADHSTKEQAPGYRAARASALVNAGQVAEALAVVAVLEKSPANENELLYGLGCVYALASTKVAEKKQEYADRAMVLLNEAVRAGWKKAAHMKNDSDLAPLRGRDDFKKLLAELGKPTEPKK